MKENKDMEMLVKYYIIESIVYSLLCYFIIYLSVMIHKLNIVTPVIMLIYLIKLYNEFY
jgi:hypothetical protein